jgi:hypothetical protein
MDEIEPPPERADIRIPIVVGWDFKSYRTEDTPSELIDALIRELNR